eukprot:CAMPEP_0178702242 /NCGR_PEP_ID=MMETSP0699-20121125/12771_1 /TAXON_ID=265572 /ORGANISM="Extubocellulus spinifer, Strain CCMP396" /LENGTH=145 /DNA_ID=CAMNT_0020348967 /DNA_START=98 /DNA_END=534 /DNA_ORIENTATION=-
MTPLLLPAAGGKQGPRGDTPSSYSLKLPEESNPGAVVYLSSIDWRKLGSSPAAAAAAAVVLLRVLAAAESLESVLPVEEVGDDDCDDADADEEVADVYDRPIGAAAVAAASIGVVPIVPSRDAAAGVEVHLIGWLEGFEGDPLYF